MASSRKIVALCGCIAPRIAVCARLLRDFTADERAQYAISDSQPTCSPVQHILVDLTVQAVF